MKLSELTSAGEVETAERVRSSLKLPRLEAITKQATEAAAVVPKLWRTYSPRVSQDVVDDPDTVDVAALPSPSVGAAERHASAVPIASAHDLGQLVRDARVQRKLSQQAFADLVGVGRRFISELENGKATLEFDKVLLVASATAASMCWPGGADERVIPRCSSRWFAEPAGTLVRTEQGALVFAYAPAHVARADALPLSLSLALTDEPYGDIVTRAFFDNLLQEHDGAPLNDVMAREGLARDDIAGLLLHLGKDCPGALSVLPAGAPAVKVPGDFATDYRAFSDEKMTAIAAALQERRPLPAGTTDPSPLAGVQSKLALTQLPDGRLAEPIPGTGAPTTHILKVPDREHPRDAAHETATLDLSRALGLETSEAAVIEIGEIEVLLVRRFDRALDGEGRVVRLHQEDFAQALGLPSLLKYERRGTADRRFDVAGIRKVLDVTANPIDERDRFIRATFST